MVKIYSKRDNLKDSRRFAYGDVWKLRDELIRLLPSDRLVRRRKIYASRTVVVVQNCLENNDENSIIIEVAPLTTTTKYLQKFDVLLLRDKDGVKQDCMVQVQLSQPVLKKDLFKKVAEISPEKKEEIAAVKLNLLGIDLNGF
ncbi:MAG TPA: type II toxin-antitoxin system PemK/MazF family toxin [Syntrophomonadaceae bacterium]|jgi:mRNA interferase MazF|nr:type II toxin-antitoxin system PemK/MazF family toxin [Syntrophomonadaceae bacterium]